MTIMDVADTMDQCDNCAEKQNWLLESGDGSQVVCTCYDRFVGSSMKRGNDCKSTFADASTQTPVKRAQTTVPDAPKRKVQKPRWMNLGCDIRRNLFTDLNWKKMEDVKDMRWAILKVDTIETSPTHRCIRRFYIGDKDGVNYLEMEFYPCVTYKSLTEKYKEMFHFQSSHMHGLCYNPRQRAPPCSVAVSKINDFIVYNDIEIILFNDDTDSYSEDVNSKICDKLGIQYMNIRWCSNEYTPIPTWHFKNEKRDDEFTMTPSFTDFPLDDDIRSIHEQAATKDLNENYRLAVKRCKTI